jgi:branched-chain amino acid transport system substrate-binding protein
MKTTRVTATLAIAALGLASLAACTAPAPAPVDPSERESLTLTTIMPITGPGAIYGEAVVKLLDILVAETNDGDGVTVGDTTYNVELEVYDDALNPETAISVAREAIDNGAKIIFGPFGSASVSGVQPLMTEGTAVWQIPIASVSGPEKNPNVFKTSAGIATFEEGEIRWITADEDIQKIALFTDQKQVGLVQSTDSLISTLEGEDREIVANQSYTSGDTDFRAPLTQILASNPDILLVRGYTAESVLITQQVRELGSDVQIVWNGGTSNADIAKLVPDESVLENTYQSIPLSSLDPFVAAGNELAIDLLDKLDGSSGAADAYVNDGYRLLIKILENSADLEVESIMEAAETLTTEDIADLKLLNTYAGQDGDLIFKDHHVALVGAFVEWVPGKGWTPVAE